MSGSPGDEGESSMRSWVYDLKPNEIREALNVPEEERTRVHRAVIDGAALRLVHVLEYGVVIAPDDNREWPDWALETAKPWERKLMEDGNYSLFARNGRDILDALHKAMKEEG